MLSPYPVSWENRFFVGNALACYQMHKQDAFEPETAQLMNREWTARLAAPEANGTPVEEMLSSLNRQGRRNGFRILPIRDCFLPFAERRPHGIDQSGHHAHVEKNQSRTRPCPQQKHSRQ